MGRVGAERLKNFPASRSPACRSSPFAAQCGEEYPTVKALKGLSGRSVLEIIADHQTDTWRAVYTVRFGDTIYVLHAFQKKSKKGIATPQKDMELVRQGWLRRSGTTEKGRTEMTRKTPKKTRHNITESGGNIFADLGLGNPEQELLKARLTLQIYRTIKGRKLTQMQAGEILGIKQPHVSSLLRGQSGTFSVERLMDFLTSLGHDIEIAVTPSRKQHGKMSVSVPESMKPAV